MDLLQRLANQESRGLTRRRRIVDGPQQVQLQVDGRKLISFCSNDYLGLANHSQVKRAFKDGIDRYGVGSGAAHLITGHSRAHQQLEEELADFVGRDRALLFSTGYMANLAILATFTDRHETIYQDRLNHASLIDGGQMSRAKVRRYQHGDIDDLARLCRLEAPKGGLVVTDGVFSMEGSIAPLDKLAGFAEQNNLSLVVDDAHGFGVLGGGRGSVVQYGLGQSQVPILMGTLGKALGTFGAFVAGSHDMIEALIQFARSYVYTTAPPAAIAEATLASLRMVRDDDGRRQRLMERIHYFRHLAEQCSLPFVDSRTPIQMLPIPNINRLMKVQRAMESRGYLLSAIRPPTVPEGGLRLTLCSEHREQDIDTLLQTLSGLIYEDSDAC